ncbi:MAG: DegT/DnrJ/EryC1/StrS family aminotransferase [Prevotellamassilia sp.]
MIPFLPLQQINHRYEPALSAAIQRVVDSGWYLLGKEVERFEHDFAAYVGTSHCVGVANGLDALTLALMAMKDYFGWETEAQVIVPNMTFVATAEAVVRAGLVPVFAEVDDSALLTVEAVDAVYTPRVRAVIPVHLYGKMAPMPALKAWADAHKNNCCKMRHRHMVLHAKVSKLVRGESWRHSVFILEKILAHWATVVR